MRKQQARNLANRWIEANVVTTLALDEKTSCFVFGDVWNVLFLFDGGSLVVLDVYGVVLVFALCSFDGLLVVCVVLAFDLSGIEVQRFIKELLPYREQSKTRFLKEKHILPHLEFPEKHLEKNTLNP